jgi:hypothetical protein
LCALLASVSTAQAELIIYTNKETFLDAVAEPILESYEDQPITTQNSDPIVTSFFTMTLLALSDSGEFRWLVTAEARPNAGTVPTEGIKFVEAAGRSSVAAPIEITFTFDDPIASFGLHIGDFGDLASIGELTLSTDNVDELVIATTPPQLANGNVLFFGITDTNPFTTIQLTKTTETDGITIDEVYFSVPGKIIVSIDIKPGNEKNNVNICSKAAFPVAILSSETFDASTEVDPLTISLAGAGVQLDKQGDTAVKKRDVNEDGNTDLVVKIVAQDLQLDSSAIEAELTGQTFDDMPIEGKDAIEIKQQMCVRALE